MASGGRQSPESASQRDPRGTNVPRSPDDAPDTIEAKSDDWQWWHAAGLALGKQGQWAKAANRLNRAIELNATTAQLWFDRGLARIQLSQWANATADFRKATQLNPDLPAPWMELARGHVAQSQWSLAADAFTQAIAQKSDDPQLWIERGRAYATLNQWDKVVADYSQAIELQPDDWKTLVARSEAHEKLKQPDKSLADIAAATALNPTDAEFWVASFRRRADQSQWPQAVAAFEKASTLGAVFDRQRRLQASWSYRGTGDTFYSDMPTKRLDAFRRGIAVAEMLVAEDPEALVGHQELFETLRHSGNLLGVLGQTQARDEHFTKSAKSLHNLLELSRTNNQALFRFNYCIAFCGLMEQPDVAHWREMTQAAVQIAPQNPDCLKSLGMTQYRLGEWPVAAEALRKSIDLRPAGDGQTWFYLAMAEWKLNNKDQANLAYDRGVGWLEKNKPDPKKWPELIQHQYRPEAAALLGKTAAKP